MRGYLHIKMMGRTYQCHRLAWMHVHGKWPDGVIDHVNRSVSDNSLKNLRDVTHRENLLNRGPYKSRATARLGEA